MPEHLWCSYVAMSLSLFEFFDVDVVSLYAAGLQFLQCLFQVYAFTHLLSGQINRFMPAISASCFCRRVKEVSKSTYCSSQAQQSYNSSTAITNPDELDSFESQQLRRTGQHHTGNGPFDDRR